MYSLELRQIKDVFDFNYPFYDEQFRCDFEEKFIEEYYFHEIGFETVGRFKQRLEAKLLLNMPYWIQLYQTELEAQGIQFLLNKDLKETFLREVDTEDKLVGSNESNNRTTGNFNGTDTMTNDLQDAKTGYLVKTDNETTSINGTDTSAIRQNNEQQVQNQSVVDGRRTATDGFGETVTSTNTKDLTNTETLNTTSAVTLGSTSTETLGTTSAVTSSSSNTETLNTTNTETTTATNKETLNTTNTEKSSANSKETLGTKLTESSSATSLTEGSTGGNRKVSSLADGVASASLEAAYLTSIEGTAGSSSTDVKNTGSNTKTNSGENRTENTGSNTTTNTGTNRTDNTGTNTTKNTGTNTTESSENNTTKNTGTNTNKTAGTDKTVNAKTGENTSTVNDDSTTTVKGQVKDKFENDTTSTVNGTEDVTRNNRDDINETLRRTGTTSTVNASTKDDTSLTTGSNKEDKTGRLMERTELISQGNIGTTSSAELLEKWRSVLINIDKIIIDECRDLFMQIF